ncbi:MAG: hypothetical protein PUP92_04955 [Rhizonema sp. PD38]|nr:hypothetical protein [Rhizonema sp. PD38]
MTNDLFCSASEPHATRAAPLSNLGDTNISQRRQIDVEAKKVIRSYRVFDGRANF